MIQRNTLGLCAVILLAATNAARASSDGKHPTYACTNVRWNEEFLQYFPKAPAACRDVTEKDGVDYARFDGRVSKIGPRFVQVEVADVAHFPIATVEFKIGSGGTAEINDRVVKVRDLKVDDRLTFWFREGQFGTLSLPRQHVVIFEPEAPFTS
ncbi:MAG: hypothetical protein WCB10_14480 [Steroidobacteraceae bacterium]